MPATPRFGPAVIAGRAEDAIAGHALLDLLAGHAGAVDAVVLAVSHDTALEAARQLMPCPVVGMTEAACLTACLLGTRFGLVTLGPVATYRERVARHGLGGRLSGLRGVPATPQEMLRDPAGVDALLRAAVAALADEGAEAVVLGGAVLAGAVPRLQPGCPVPLLDGIACAVKLAEALVALRPARPRAGTLAPSSGRESAGLSAELAALLRG